VFGAFEDCEGAAVGRETWWEVGNLTLFEFLEFAIKIPFIVSNCLC